ncbi:transposase [Paraburkholderia ribeironis]|uniref:Transposase n=1 Tax=Paraburkholderia ribeironis TaxID=1247936 RepID=A0A1N7SQF7_9BURK|nr:transposase [Paraburkholderia ribeironis]SIT49540.1 transposase [Paraburkholderia ribeironis]
MAGNDSELRVVRLSRDGRRRYDEDGKRALVEVALRPGVSVARLAQEHGINANLLRKWTTKYLMEREKGISLALLKDDDADERGPSPPAVEVMDGKAIGMPDSRKRPAPTESSSAFVPVVSPPPAPPPPSVSPAPPMTLSLHVCLSNGVELDLSAASIDELSTVVQMFGRMPCSGSTKS